MATMQASVCCMWHTCGSADLSAKRRIMRRVILATCLSIAGMFAAAAIAAPMWAFAQRDPSYDDDVPSVKVVYGLFRSRSGGHSRRYKANDFALSATWRAVLLNEGAALVVLIAVVGVAAHYWSSACCFVSHITEFILGSFFIALGFCIIATSTIWSVAFMNEFRHYHEFYDDYEYNTDDRNSCGAGCALEAVTGCLCVGLGVAMVVIAGRERCHCCVHWPCCPCGSPASNTEGSANAEIDGPAADTENPVAAGASQPVAVVQTTDSVQLAQPLLEVVQKP